MPALTCAYGIVLILLGVIAYATTGGVSVTALIPTFFGVPVLLCGILAYRPGLRKHVMHVVSLLALLAVGGTVPGLVKLPALVTGGDAARPAAVMAQSIMCGLSAVFLGFCIASFVRARQNRKGAGGDTGADGVV